MTFRQVLQSLPSQLAKENKRFIYSAVKKGSRAAEFEIAIQWLIDAGLVYKVSRVNKVAVPLRFYEDIEAFKLFFLDIGLLCCMAGVPASAMLINTDALTEYKGMISEQYVAQQLSSADIDLFYWSNPRTPAELDFVVQLNGRVYPIEVKAGANVRGKSLSQFLKENDTAEGLRYSLLPYKQQDRLTNIPLYELPFRI